MSNHELTAVTEEAINSTTNDDDDDDEQRLKAAVHFSCTNIIQSITASASPSDILPPVFDESFMVCCGQLTYGIVGNLANDLCKFAMHAKRRRDFIEIVPNDVLLCTRKIPNVRQKLQSMVKSTASSTTVTPQTARRNKRKRYDKDTTTPVSP